MHYFHFVEGFKSWDHLDHHFPYFVLLEKGLIFLVVDDFLVEVSIIRILHDDAQWVAQFVNEYVFVTDDVGVFDWS